MAPTRYQPNTDAPSRVDDIATLASALCALDGLADPDDLRRAANHLSHEIIDAADTITAPIAAATRCGTCEGVGMVSGDTGEPYDCDACDGTGRVSP